MSRIPAEDLLVQSIYVLRDQKVILDDDLAALYGVETRARRNRRYFGLQTVISTW